MEDLIVEIVAEEFAAIHEALIGILKTVTLNIVKDLFTLNNI